MTREIWTLETRKQVIILEAAAIAGAAWHDSVQIGTLAEQLRQVAYSVPLSNDDDPANDNIGHLLSLAREAEELGL